MTIVLQNYLIKIKEKIRKNLSCSKNQRKILLRKYQVAIQRIILIWLFEEN
jgi:hypothetical protein